uniref:Microfibril associated protein 5 n=1 Tax=Buteo japonicus TaxID=224669 RepID=A0A8B9Z162_9AVES
TLTLLPSVFQFSLTVKLRQLHQVRLSLLPAPPPRPTLTHTVTSPGRCWLSTEFCLLENSLHPSDSTYASASDAGLHLSLCVFPDCREEKFPCTRLYSVHKPVKQCISYLCVTSVRRMYIINKEVCSRIVCKENEVMQDEICRQLAGLPSRRLRRSGQPLHLPCRQLLEQQQRRRPDAL